LDIYLVRLESSIISRRVVSGISDHNGILIEVDWAEYCHEAQVGRDIPSYHKTDIADVQVVLREAFKLWAGSGSCIEEIWIGYKETLFVEIEHHVHKETLRKNPDPE
jgi:hypothetical protein